MTHLPSLNRHFRRALARSRQIHRGEDGVSALEFALVAPFLLALYFGSIELSLLMQADRSVTSAASTMGDIAARAASINDADMAEILGSTRIVLDPLPVASARLRVSSLVSDNDGNVTVDWSDAQNMTALAEDSTFSGLPTGVLPPNGSLIYAEVEFNYTSSVGLFVQGSKTLREQFYLRPRRVARIPRNRS